MSDATEASERLLDALHGTGPARDAALAELHALLVRGAHHELRRRRDALARLSTGDIDDLAHQAADDALIAILRKLDEFGGTSRFSTWASKFALHEAGVKGRQRAWQNRKLGLDTQAWRQIGAADGLSTQVVLEDRETLGVLRDSIRLDLTPHQREVLTALAINGIPIDVLAERCDTTRGALYKTLHDARRKLRLALVVAGQAEVTPLE